MWASSNPVLANNDDAFSQFYGKDMFVTKPDVISLQGVVNKTAILVAIATVFGAGGYWLTQQAIGLNIVMISCLASMAVGFGIGLVLRGRPQQAMILAPIYAAVEGVFLGALSGALDGILARSGMAALGGVAVQAFIITLAITLAMLGLYSARIIKPSKPLFAIVGVATFGIMLTYLISWPLGLLFGIDLPLIGLTSAFGQGWTPILGIGINVFILGIASLWLIIDFKMIEDKLAEGAPRYMEWYCGFALMVTLAWIYYEAVKLAFRIAVLLNSRD